MKKFAATALAAALAAAVYGQVAINECDYQNPGTDATEWIELVGAAGTDLSGWTIRLLNQTGSEYGSYPLQGSIPNDFTSAWGGDGGFYVMGVFDVATSTAFGAPDYTPAGWATNMIQNGPDDIIVLQDPSGAIVDEWQYDSDAPGGLSLTTASQTFSTYDSAGTDGVIDTYSSIGRIGYSFDAPLFAFDSPQAQLGVMSWNDTFDHETNTVYSGTGPAWTAPSYTGAAFSTVGPYTESSSAEVQWSGTASSGANRGLSPGTFNNASYGAGGQDPYTINIVPEPASMLLLAFGVLALRRR